MNRVCKHETKAIREIRAFLEARGATVEARQHRRFVQLSWIIAGEMMVYGLGSSASSDSGSIKQALIRIRAMFRRRGLERLLAPVSA